MNPMVSIVMPVYNSQEFLPQSVGTILSQTLPDFELILVDDGSKDTSLTMLQEYQKQDSRIQVIAQENQGAGVARNTGMAIARGKYILFLDSDDYFESNMLEVMVKKAEETRADVTICRATCFDHHTGGALPSDWLRKDKYLNRVEGRTTFTPVEMRDCLFQFTYGWAWDKLLRRDFVRANGIFFPNLRHSEDLVFVYLALVTAEKITVISESLIFYRMNRSSSVSNQSNNRVKDVWTSMDLFEVELKNRNKYDVFQQSFLNWAMEFCVWNVSNLQNKEVQKQEYYRVKRELLKKYPFREFRFEYYHSKLIYGKYLLVKFSIYPIFCVVLRTYKEYKKRGLEASIFC